MKRYVVTGGRGVIGSLFARSRMAQGDEVLTLDDSQAPRSEFNDEGIGCEFWVLGHPFKGNWRDAARCDRILHAAASTGIPYSADAPLDDLSRNIDGTVDVLEAVRQAPRPLVALSSVKPYGLSRLCALERIDHYSLSGGAVDETFPLAPDEIYAASKAAQSLICQAYAKSYALPIVVFRCSNLYGPAAPHGARHGWLTWLCIRAALGRTIEIQGTGRQTRDMLFASDVESAALVAFEALEAGRLGGEIFNLGGGVDNCISVLQVVEYLRKLGAKFDVREAPGRKHEDMLFVTDTSKFRNATGWRPRVRVHDGLERVYLWAKENAEQLAKVYPE